MSTTTIGLGTDVPDWSGHPFPVGEFLLVPLHVADERSFRPPQGWVCDSYCESDDGEVEYHIYRKGRA